MDILHYHIMIFVFALDFAVAFAASISNWIIGEYAISFIWGVASVASLFGLVIVII